MKSYFLAIGNVRFEHWDELPQLEIESEERSYIIGICYYLSAINNNCMIRLSESKGFNNQGAYITNKSNSVNIVNA